MPKPVSPLSGAHQLVLVVAPAWNSTSAELRRFERQGFSADWRQTGAAFKVSLGKSGLAWGLGVHREMAAGAVAKREGDGCSPAGVFAITELFGYANQHLSAKLPYRSATRELKCIDDPASSHYNRIVDQGALDQVDWQSHEEMLRRDERYEIGAVVAHNSPQPVPGAGSCIFIHVWQSEGVPTAGCTAGALPDIAELCTWLDGSAAPLLVQLPRSEYLRLRVEWSLPELAR